MINQFKTSMLPYAAICIHYANIWRIVVSLGVSWEIDVINDCTNEVGDWCSYVLLCGAFFLAKMIPNTIATMINTAANMAATIIPASTPGRIVCVIKIHTPAT